MTDNDTTHKTAKEALVAARKAPVGSEHPAGCSCGSVECPEWRAAQTVR